MKKSLLPTEISLQNKDGITFKMQRQEKLAELVVFFLFSAASLWENCWNTSMNQLSATSVQDILKGPFKYLADSFNYPLPFFKFSNIPV